jgi:hypothetical protein
MRGFLIFLLVVGLGIVFWRQKQREAASASTKPVVSQSQSIGVKQPPPPQLTPAPRGQASQYNYMKRALDRAADVRDQARAQTKEAQDP